METLGLCYLYTGALTNSLVRRDTSALKTLSLLVLLAKLHISEMGKEQLIVRTNTAKASTECDRQQDRHCNSLLPLRSCPRPEPITLSYL